MSQAIPEDFSATLNLQPPDNNSLRVAGSVEVSSKGWIASLTRAVPQGTNPLVLILDLKLTPPSGKVNQVITRIPAHYLEDPAQHRYTDVTIRNGGDNFTIKVKVVQ